MIVKQKQLTALPLTKGTLYHFLHDSTQLCKITHKSMCHFTFSSRRYKIVCTRYFSQHSLQWRFFRLLWFWLSSWLKEELKGKRKILPKQAFFEEKGQFLPISLKTRVCTCLNSFDCWKNCKIKVWNKHGQTVINGTKARPKVLALGVFLHHLPCYFCSIDKMPYLNLKTHLKQILSSLRFGCFCPFNNNEYE